MLLSLWIVFLAFQLEKSKYGHCSKQFLGIFAAQAVFCISLTVYFIRHELAELGKPAGLSHEDPEMHELLVGERSGVPPGMLLHCTINICFWCFSNEYFTVWGMEQTHPLACYPERQRPWAL